MKALFHSNLFIGLSAGLLTAGSFKRLGLEVDTPFTIWVILATASLYTIQRLMKLRTYSLSTEMMAWVATNKKQLAIYTGILLIGALVSGANLPWKLMLDLWPLVLLSLLYAFPVIPGKGGQMALRDLPGLKVFMIALVWTYVSFAMPLKLNGRLIGPMEFSLVLERFAFILAITLPFDIRDLNLDAPSMHTVPQLIGAQRATILSVVLIGLSLGIEMVHLNEDLISLNQMIWLSVFYVFVAVIIVFGKKQRPYWYYNGILDGSMAVLGLIHLSIF